MAPVDDLPGYPGAHAPDRTRDVDSSGVRISVKEWGDPEAPPVLVAHGGFDFARTLDVFAPMLVEGGWRVVSWDQRGHGDSDHAALYSWDADIRDAVAVFSTVLDSTKARSIPVVGHSKGGGLTLHLADALPHRVRALVNVDGLPSFRNSPDVSERERTRFMARELGNWLDHRLTVDGRRRRPGTLEELAERRGRMNPRLSIEWLRYLAGAGARHDADGWRWKLDPTLRFGGFGPWRPEWMLLRLPGLAMPFLGVLGRENETMGGGMPPSDVEPYLPPGARLEVVADAGHFVHIEQPRAVADLALEFLGEPS
jgi:pimeloyl-ACP methyl ester carboxylesterase